MQKTVAGADIQVNEEGFMTDFREWNPQIGAEIAQEANIEMTPRHWEVIAYLQKEYKSETAISIRRIGKSGVLDIKEFYQLFPNAPLKTAARIAGIPKPASCI